MAGFGGLQFQPGVPQNGDRPGSGQRGRLQEPVQVLSTRLPKFFGSGAIAPAPLLQGGGGMGQPGAQGNVVAQALAQLAGLPPGMAPSAPDGMASGGGSFSSMFGLPGLQAPAGGGFSGSSAPLPPPPFQPPPFNPPPPLVRPGDMQPSPWPRPSPEPGPPPMKQPIEEPPPRVTLPPHEGWGDFPQPIREPDGPPGTKEPQFDEGLIRMLAGSLFRERGPFTREF